MSIDFATFTKVAPLVTAVKKPVLLRGRHGIGKSCVVYQTAADLGLPVVERRASQMTEGDLVGLPIIDGECTRFNPPDWFHRACNEAVVLFLDEVDRATIEVRQGIFELTDSRKLNGHVLHADTLIFAAVNGGEHGEQYQVGEMDPAELDRWTVFDVEPTIEDWLTWAKENIGDVIWNFINQNRNHLEHTGEFEPNKVYPSRRSWDRLNECLEAAGFLTEENRMNSLPMIYELTTAFVGFEAAVTFRDFCEKYENQVLIEDILDKGQLEKVKDFSINDHCAFVEKMESAGVYENLLTDNQTQNIVDYFVELPSEIAVKLFVLVGDSVQENSIKMHGCAPTNRPSGFSMGVYIAELYTGKKEQNFDD
jgi:midasin (ATPase involved in ribosome maturation)